MAKKLTCRPHLNKAASLLDGAIMQYTFIKDDMEAEIDRMDQQASKKPLSPAQHKRYHTLYDAVDELDRIVGHLTEADGYASHLKV
jgi:hypothetical protein